MTVAELLKDLGEFPPDAEVVFCTGPADDLDVLSIYLVEAKTAYRREDVGKVAFDLGPSESDA